MVPSFFISLFNSDQCISLGWYKFLQTLCAGLVIPSLMVLGHWGHCSQGRLLELMDDLNSLQRELVVIMRGLPDFESLWLLVLPFDLIFFIDLCSRHDASCWAIIQQEGTQQCQEDVDAMFLNLWDHKLNKALLLVYLASRLFYIIENGLRIISK